MGRIWKQAVRSMAALGLTAAFMFASGCGDDDNDHRAGTDTTPAAFTFTNMTGVAPNTVVTSAPITVSGIDAAAPISVTGTGGSYSIGNAAFTTAAGTVTNGQTVRVRHTSAATNSAVTTTTLNIGGVTAPFITVTEAPAGADTTPAAFAFTPLTGAALGRALTSNVVTITGIDTPVPISVTNGAYSINGGAFTSNLGVVSSGQTVALRSTSSALNNTPTTTTVNIGGVSQSFTTTTFTSGGTFTTPAAFSFANVTGAALNTAVTSAPVTISGNTAAAPVTVTGGTYSIGSGAFVSTAGTVDAGQTIRVRQTASASPNTETIATLNVGGVAVPFTVKTGAATSTDTTPTPFTFTNMTSVAVSTVVTSAPITVSGINAPAPISVAGGTYSIGSGAFVSTAGTVTNGQTVRVRHTSSASNNTVTTTTLTIGGVSGTFTSTTEAAGLDAFQIYQTKFMPGDPTQTCAACHRLGTLDTTGNGPDLAGTTQMALRFPNPGAAGHFGIVLTAEEIAALTALFTAQAP